MTGTTWVEESGLPPEPRRASRTRTRSASYGRRGSSGLVKRGLDGEDWSSSRRRARRGTGALNDINGFHVKKEHVFAALRQRAIGPVAEGNVGGGTGMICHRFKGGIERPRRVHARDADYAVGVLVQCNYGRPAQRPDRRVPVGEEIPGAPTASTRGRRRCATSPPGNAGARAERSSSSSPPTCRCCPISSNASRRARLAWGLQGIGRDRWERQRRHLHRLLDREPGAEGGARLTRSGPSRNDDIDAVFDATVQATEEAIINAMVAARDHDRQRRELPSTDSTRDSCSRSCAPPGACPNGA